MEKKGHSVTIPDYLNCSQLIILSLLLLMVVIIGSCSIPEKKSDADKILTDQARSAKYENIFEDIHKQIYENSLGARAKAIETLNSLNPDDQVYKVILLKHIGSSYVFETNYSEAIKYYNEALSIAEKIELYSELANINNNLGVIYNEIGNYKTAYIHFVEALNYYDLADIKDKKVGTLNNIGLVYINLKNYEKALTYFDEALNSFAKPKDSILIVSVMNNIALCYISENKPGLALDYLDRAIDMSEDINNQYGLCISHQIMGNLYAGIDETEKALKAYTTSVEIASGANLTYQRAISRLGIARLLLKQNKTDEAFKVTIEIMGYVKELKSLVLETELHQVLSAIYEKKKDYKSSLIHLQDHIKSQQELVNQTVIHQIYDVELKYLNQQNKMQQLELEKKELTISKKNNLLLFISLIFVLLLSGLYLLYLNHHHRQKVKLQKTIIELTEKKTHAVLEAEIQERKRIGQELHDSLGHLLSLTGLHASAMYKRQDITEEKRKELHDSLMKIIDDAFEEVRNISHNLAPYLLSERGLKGALKSIADRVNQSARLTMNYDTYGLTEKLDSLIENTLYRTIQEIVNNTIKHADATSLFIQITEGNNEITLIAEDNGKGFNSKDTNKQTGFGLSHMKSRIENLNGTMYIDSNINRGTIISIFIPFR
ncbi:MAG: hypothetical protein CVU06_07340 [Bacteroidetes bacterium HGW-Bacteroidetes-22]|nr:MAG: hypothetical protein CVU06_07340 [Bacteroidetes bacterium HGW-Bacteroidetes-22]